MDDFGNVVFIQPRVGEDGDCALKGQAGVQKGNQLKQ